MLQSLIRPIAVLSLTLAVAGAACRAPDANYDPETVDRRVALVIGIAKYTGQPDLGNPAKDARAVATALAELGFQVTLGVDPKTDELDELVADFSEGLKATDVALFYFSGHGVQVDGTNYLLPSDYEGNSADDATFRALNVTDVKDRIAARAQYAMLLLDACRNNPYLGNKGGDGLAEMEAHGTAVVYATQAGKVANGLPYAKHSLFTDKLLAALEEPGLTARKLFQRVRNEVAEASNSTQIPSVEDEVRGGGTDAFVFRPAHTAPLPRATQAKTAPQAKTTPPQCVALQFPDTGTDGYLVPSPRDIQIPLTVKSNTCTEEVSFHVELVPQRGTSIYQLHPECANKEDDCWPREVLRDESEGHSWPLRFPRPEPRIEPGPDDYIVPMLWSIRQRPERTLLDEGSLSIRFSTQ